jgi:hypothetical protein
MTRNSSIPQDKRMTCIVPPSPEENLLINPFVERKWIWLLFDFTLKCETLQCTIYLLTYLWRWALLEEEPILQLLKNFPAFYGTRRFITVFTRVLHWFLSWARSIQSIPSHPISLRSKLILSTHLHLGLPSGHFPSGFSTNILYAFLVAPVAQD